MINPSQLLHYPHQHEQAITLGMITGSEELDLFTMFLDQGLHLGDHLDQDGNPTAAFVTLSMTDPLHAYYLHQTEQRRTPAPKPRQEWSPKAFGELTTQLERERPDGWTTAALNLHQGDRRSGIRSPRWCADWPAAPDSTGAHTTRPACSPTHTPRSASPACPSETTKRLINSASGCSPGAVPANT